MSLKTGLSLLFDPTNPTTCKTTMAIGQASLGCCAKGARAACRTRSLRSAVILTPTLLRCRCSASGSAHSAPVSQRCEGGGRSAVVADTPALAARQASRGCAFGTWLTAYRCRNDCLGRQSPPLRQKNPLAWLPSVTWRWPSRSRSEMALARIRLNFLSNHKL